MKTYARYVIAAFAAGLGIFLFYLSASAWGNLISAKNRMQFYLEQPVSIRDARETEQQIEEEQRKSVQQEDTEEMPEFCIWGQKEQVILTNDNLSRSIQADMILLCGNPELLFEDCRVPDRKDRQGCLVDEETAWELFGSFEVVGEEISYEGNSYIIRKVIPGKEKIFALQAAALEGNGSAEGKQSLSGPEGSQPEQTKDNHVLNRITMQKPEGKSVRDLELAWAIHGLSAVTLDLELLRGIGGFFVLLVPATLCIYFLWYLYRQFREEKQIAWKATIAVMGLVLTVCFLLLLKNQVNIPDDYIPTRWSEFSFWTELWNEKQETIRLMLQIPKTILDYGWMGAFGKTLGFGVLAELLVILCSFNCNKL